MAHLLTDEYIAGFFDGEGCVTVNRWGPVPHIAVLVGQKDPTVLRAILERFPDGHLHLFKGYHRITYTGWKALPLLEAIHPHLVSKRRKAWLAMRLIKFSCVGSRGGAPACSDKERTLRWKIADVLQERVPV